LSVDRSGARLTLFGRKLLFFSNLKKKITAFFGLRP
jgi:hypothetical protein